jgi:hypothetical protein
VSERDLNRVWCDAKPRLNAACDANDQYAPPLWLCASAAAVWCVVGNWIVGLFW